MCELDMLYIVCLGRALEVKMKQLSNLSVTMTHVSILFNFKLYLFN